MTQKLKVLDLFSGIGGFSLGLERTGGFQTVAFCEIEEFPRRVLAKHWPEVPCYHDVRELTADTLRRDGISVDVITGGFPCQDISTAGRQTGINEGTRSGLWSEIVRLIGELRPRHVIVENVANLLRGPSERPGAWFGRVLGDLAECGYDAEWSNIPASFLGACHRRERIWIVANPSGQRSQRLQRELEKLGKARQGWPVDEEAGEQLASDSASVRRQGPGRSERPINPEKNEHRETDYAFPILGWPTKPAVRGRDDGFSRGLDKGRLKSLGNSVVPQIPELIGHAILSSLGVSEDTEAAA